MSWWAWFVALLQFTVDVVVAYILTRRFIFATLGDRSGGWRDWVIFLVGAERLSWVIFVETYLFKGTQVCMLTPLRFLDWYLFLGGFITITTTPYFELASHKLSYHPILLTWAGLAAIQRCLISILASVGAYISLGGGAVQLPRLGAGFWDDVVLRPLYLLQAVCATL